MRRWICLLLSLMLPFAALAQQAQEPVSADEVLLEDRAADALDHEKVEDKLSAVFARYQTLGACVCAIQNGEVTYTYCYGDRNTNGDPVTPDTVFQVGSISKMVSNIGLMQLLQAKGLSLDTELGQVLGYPVRAPDHPDTPVTLRQLMSHTAALRDGGAYGEALGGKIRALRELFGGARAQTLFHAGREPGMRREYSNFGGGLIGSLIEKLSGQTLDAYMTEHVFAPLGVTAAYQAARLPAGVPTADLYQMPQRRVTKVLREDKTNVTAPDPEHDYVFTAGKLMISAPDLSRLLIALCDGGVYGDTRILKESAVRDMTTRQNYIGSVACESGHGLFMNIITDDQVEGRTMYGHGGKANGMLCAAYFDPTDRTGVVMLTNGCQNRSVHNGVGMLGRMIMRVCYNDLIDPAHETEDPFLLE